MDVHVQNENHEEQNFLSVRKDVLPCTCVGRASDAGNVLRASQWAELWAAMVVGEVVTSLQILL
jgi:hypothetical protein